MRVRQQILATAIGLSLILGVLGEVAYAASPAVKASRPPDSPKVDLNHASAAMLMSLPGIGPKRAQAIIARRRKRPFRRIREIRRIRGVGWKTFRRLRSRLTVTPRKR